jgi:metal-sulfur cluster biosynthetic enzyme
MADPVVLRKLVVEALQTVFDPEVPVNIHELGLIYGIGVDPAGAVTVRMTLTAPGCPAAQELPSSRDAGQRRTACGRRV